MERDGAGWSGIAIVPTPDTADRISVGILQYARLFGPHTSIERPSDQGSLTYMHYGCLKSNLSHFASPTARARQASGKRAHTALRQHCGKWVSGDGPPNVRADSSRLHGH